MTQQEIFDYVATFLIQQGKPAVDLNGNCQYRAPDGCRCAAGCLIPDDRYDPSMEGNCIDDIICKYGDVLPSWMTGNHELILNLQEAHDTAAKRLMFIPVLKRRLRRTATLYGLSDRVLDA